MLYKGYEYEQEIDQEPDCRKIFHEIIRPDGSMVDWKLHTSEWKSISPYRSATREEFQAVVDHIRFQDFCSQGVDN